MQRALRLSVKLSLSSLGCSWLLVRQGGAFRDSAGCPWTVLNVLRAYVICALPAALWQSAGLLPQTHPAPLIWHLSHAPAAAQIVVDNDQARVKDGLPVEAHITAGLNHVNVVRTIAHAWRPLSAHVTAGMSVWDSADSALGAASEGETWLLLELCDRGTLQVGRLEFAPLPDFSLCALSWACCPANPSGFPRQVSDQGAGMRCAPESVCLCLFSVLWASAVSIRRRAYVHYAPHDWRAPFSLLSFLDCSLTGALG